ncbi:glycosyltransferase family 2 protein [Arthrobacter sp. MI7-26]|uniref:glycosyltransferase family 2 protein n=1 Tax=Arthrobacter sp. MI7-26 TaxID=2993653 RepID=UPI0022491A55|nr:glycosyltransferase family 2 protein [Arthrobacter sp. MI7-26]MCX2747051.1 glycosyltransferase family 2 protein [Arthrobacter sp. MI7-26]
MNDTEPATMRTAPSDLVVVLLATFDGARYLRQQLDSIAAQSHRHWRLIVADDGSRDGTLAIVESFADDHPDRVRIVRGGPAGSARDNFFRLLRIADPAPYFAFCDQDDVWSFDKLERLVLQCQQDEAEHRDQPCLVYSDLKVVDAQLGILNPSFLDQVRARPHDITHKTLLAENAIPGCAMLFNAALADVFRAREFDARRAIMHDWWLGLLASTVGHISYIPTPLVNYRQHDANALGSVERSGLGFALSKLFRGDRSVALRTYGQADAFLGAYGDLLDATVREEIRTFASLYHRNKFERVRLLLKHGILKQTLGRRVYQLLRG